MILIVRVCAEFGQPMIVIVCVCAEYGQPIIVIPWVVLQELDCIKSRKEVCSVHCSCSSCSSP